jgi:hypothetical protein
MVVQADDARPARASEQNQPPRALLRKVKKSKARQSGNEGVRGQKKSSAAPLVMLPDSARAFPFMPRYPIFVQASMLRIYDGT